jgi:hypothetical protein
MLSTIQKLMLAFVTLIVGLVLVGQVATVGVGVTSKKAITNEAISIAPAYAGDNQIDPAIVFTVVNAPTGWKSTDCPLTNVILTNGSGTAWTATTNYVFTASTGKFTLVNVPAVNQSFLSDNSSLIDYTYCGNDYLNSDWQRTVLNLTPGFFALALLIFSVGMFYSMARDAGIL